MTTSPFSLRWLLGTMLLLSGCLPSSCSRTETRALTPTDSLSRALALETPEDTLSAVWSRAAAELPGLSFPRTVAFSPDGALYVADAEANTLLVLTADGQVQRTIEADFDAPYLAGFRGDTVVVFNPTPARFDLVADGGVRRSVSVPGLPADQTLLRYGTAWSGGFAFKGASDDTPAFILLLDAQGQLTERIDLEGPFWQYAGLLRAMGDDLYSLSFYRPVVYRVQPGATAPPVPTPLLGFDSPMLARTRLFLSGEEHEPPLLTSAAASADTLLFALNMRPGWVQIDAFGPDGHLVRRLIQPDPGAERNFFPIHLDARARDGGYDLAVVLTRPEARVMLYRWTP